MLSSAVRSCASSLGESPGPEQGVGSCTTGQVEFGQDPEAGSWEAAASHWPFDHRLKLGGVVQGVTFQALWGTSEAQGFAGDTSSVCHLLALRL